MNKFLSDRYSEAPKDDKSDGVIVNGGVSAGGST
jgi:hypothetical protein